MNKTAQWLGGAVRRVLCIGLVVSATTTLDSQSSNPVQSNPTAVDSVLQSLPDPTARIPNAASYHFPDGKQQFHNYLCSAFGPAAFTRAAVGA